MTSSILERAQETATRPLQERLKQYDWGLVFIAGPTCSGKTTLSHVLENYFWAKSTSVTIIREDDYFKNIEKIPRGPKGYLTDSMDAFYLSELKEDFKKYLQNGKAELPIYDIATNKRLPSKQYVLKSDITIVEGLHTISLFYGMENSLFIYMDTPIAVCLDRRINRDRLALHIPEERIIQHFNDCIMPSYEKEILPQRNKHGVILYNT